MPTIDTSPHTILGQRFVIEAPAGSGGMGTVFRARDLQTDRLVALKLLHGKGVQPQDLERFSREAQLLSELRHPNIVGYIAHGQPEEGVAYLAMEWLSGEDMGERLARGRLTLRESIVLLERVTNALAMAHRRNIVHRDIKPSNIFLRDKQIEQATLLDFGLARRAISGRPMTRSGTVLGTLDYMAPEQARGHQKEIGPAADIFSLGIVLYECLTGQPPFSGEEMAAVLAKILFEEVPPIRRLMPQLPRQVETLVMRMLAKDPHQRPPDATALLGELAALGELPTSGDGALFIEPSSKSPDRTALADREQLLVSVVIAAPPRPAESLSFGALAPRFEESWSGPSYSTVRRALSELGAFCELLADGTLAAALTENASATDQVVQAARCALYIQERWPEARVALATGRGQLNERLPVGEAIERAVRLVRRRGTHPSSDRQVPRPIVEGIWLDEVSAGLLDSRFIVVDSEQGPMLQSERLAIDESRTLLGVPTPCVGREQELGALDAALTSCLDESGARAVLVTAAPGIGKSRLRHEFLRRLEARSQNIEIILGRCEPMSAGTPYAVLNDALRRLCGLTGRDTPAEQRAKLRARLCRHVAPADALRVGEFLGEVCRLTFPDDASIKMRAARNDPKIMRDQIGQAFLTWLRAECTQHTIFLILEDLHWGDPLTARLLDVSLRELQDQPFMVLALARPEVMQLFPNLWEERRVQKLRLGLLTRKVCERFVYQILGREVSPLTVARIVEQAAGNALYLEELVRAVAEGKGDALPETVLAMLQSRISRLEPGARRVLRGASLFGSTFWLGGVRALYGGGRATSDMERWLNQLITAEIIEQRRESRFPEEIEYVFRHVLMRDAAYSLLTDEDRTLGHRLVANYLERLGEKDAKVLAEHFQLGHELERAVEHYVRAAEQSYTGHDLQGALDRAAKAEACGAQAEVLGRVRALQFLSYFARTDWPEALPLGLESLNLLKPGSFWWCTAMSRLFILGANLNRPDMMQDLVGRFADAQAAPDARSPYIAMASDLVIMFSLLGQPAPAQLFLERMLAAGALISEQDAALRCSLRHGHGWYLRFLTAELYKTRQIAEESVQAFLQSDDLRGSVLPHALLGLSLGDLGDRESGEATLRASLAIAERTKDAFLIVNASTYLASLLAQDLDAAKVDEAHRLALHVLELNVSPNYTGFVHTILSQIQLRRGHFAAAEEEARRSVELLAMMATYRISATINLTRALLGLGRIDEARATAEAALKILESIGGAGFNEVSVWLAAAEARHAAGDVAAAHEALRSAQKAIMLRAEKIPQGPARERFLTQVGDNARTQQLAAEWLVVP